VTRGPPATIGVSSWGSAAVPSSAPASAPPQQSLLLALVSAVGLSAFLPWGLARELVRPGVVRVVWGGPAQASLGRNARGPPKGIRSRAWIVYLAVGDERRPKRHEFEVRPAAARVAVVAGNPLGWAGRAEGLPGVK